MELPFISYGRTIFLQIHYFGLSHSVSDKTTFQANNISDMMVLCEGLILYLTGRILYSIQIIILQRNMYIMLVPYFIIYLFCVYLLSLLLFYHNCIICMLFIVGQYLL